MTAAILPIPILLLLKVFAYKGVFHLKGVSATYTTCTIIAGSPLAALVLSILPVPFVLYLTYVAVAVLPVYLTMKYTGVGLFPEALLIAVPIESVSWVAYAFLIAPLFGS